MIFGYVKKNEKYDVICLNIKFYYGIKDSDLYFVRKNNNQTAAEKKAKCEFHKFSDLKSFFLSFLLVS